jgi:hypothetical protein
MPVRDSYHYPLPDGLREGMLVRLIKFDHGYWTVRHDGEDFVVFTAQVDSGFEYEWQGRWLPATHPAVIQFHGHVPGRRKSVLQ